MSIVSDNPYRDGVSTWDHTVVAHREGVRGTVLDAAARLVGRDGLAVLSMSGLAQEAGIGRATLYKYFADREAVLAAWHQRELGRHLERVEQARQQHELPADQLAAVLHAYAHGLAHAQPGEQSAHLHEGPAVHDVRARVADVVAELLTMAGPSVAGLDPAELASYAVHALGAAADARDPDAVERLLALVLGQLGLQLH